MPGIGSEPRSYVRGPRKLRERAENGDTGRHGPTRADTGRARERLSYLRKRENAEVVNTVLGRFEGGGECTHLICPTRGRPAMRRLGQDLERGGPNNV